ncbi:porin [Aquaspirillum serpens]|uniref:porin n=1 Tax=Aquaspirillum serpens TaxID=190 RepID=UPI0003B4143A|nr:porin [Aquaspirillum serpens]
MKKLIAIAIATLPAAAMADVVLYGKLAAEVGYNKTLGDSFVNAPNGDLKGGMTVNMVDTSRIGFKGSEDLGNGLKAIWQVEQGLSFDDNSTGNRFATRDSFIGVEGGFGKVRVGRLSTYQNSDMEQVDPWMYGSAKGSVNGLGIFTRTDGRVNNAIRYDSPNFGGFTVSALYGADEVRAYNAGERTDKNTANLAVAYSNNGIFAAYSYLRYGDAIKNNEAGHGHRVEAGYDANNLYVALGYQQVKGGEEASYGSYSGAIPAGLAGNEVKTREMALTASYTIGAITPRVSFAKGWDMKVNGTEINDSGYNQFVIGADYALSKRTAAYVSYGQVNWDSNIAKDTDKEQSFGVGVRHNF